MNNNGCDELIHQLFPDTCDQVVVELPSDHGDHRSYYIENQSGQSYCLRIISDPSIDRSARCFQRLLFLAHRFACVPQPVRHGVCNHHQQRYLLSRWVRGEPVRRRLGQYSTYEDYASGIDYGLALKQLHIADRLSSHGPAAPSLRQPFSLWCERIFTMLEQAERSENSVRLPPFLTQLVRTKSSVWTQLNTTWLHGRPGPEYAVLTPRSGLVLTGMTGSCNGHPYRDLASLILNTGTAWPVFLTGVFDGYFAGSAGSHSYQTLRLFTAIEILWRCYGRKQTPPSPVEQRKIEQVLTAYRDFHDLVPAWYQPLPRISKK